MSINAGDKLCTTGMSGKIYTDIVSNLPGGQLPSGFTPAATTAMKLQIYSFAKGISDEINQDGGSGGGSTQVPPGVKTQVDLTRYINSLGIISGSKQYTEMFAKMEGNKLPLR